jgi:hypothetical protein
MAPGPFADCGAAGSKRLMASGVSQNRRHGVRPRTPRRPRATAPTLWSSKPGRRRGPSARQRSDELVKVHKPMATAARPRLLCLRWRRPSSVCSNTCSNDVWLAARLPRTVSGPADTACASTPSPARVGGDDPVARRACRVAERRRELASLRRLRRVRAHRRLLAPGGPCPPRYTVSARAMSPARPNEAFEMVAEALRQWSPESSGCLVFNTPMQIDWSGCERPSMSACVSRPRTKSRAVRAWSEFASRAAGPGPTSVAESAAAPPPQSFQSSNRRQPVDVGTKVIDSQPAAPVDLDRREGARRDELVELGSADTQLLCGFRNLDQQRVHVLSSRL